jgi:hypothetical protein
LMDLISKPSKTSVTSTETELSTNVKSTPVSSKPKTFGEINTVLKMDMLGVLVHSSQMSVKDP